jgi:hypothetical protein
MNTAQATKRQYRRVLADLAAIVLVGVALAAPSAAASAQNIHGGGSNASTTSFDIAHHVEMRKLAWAQDRVDQAWLYS